MPRIVREAAALAGEDAVVWIYQDSVPRDSVTVPPPHCRYELELRLPSATAVRRVRSSFIAFGRNARASRRKFTSWPQYDAHVSGEKAEGQRRQVLSRSLCSDIRKPLRVNQAPIEQGAGDLQSCRDHPFDMIGAWPRLEALMNLLPARG
jgi:hypothetical protein